MVSLVCCIKVFHSLDGIDFEDRGQLELNGLKPKFAKPTIVPVEYLQQSNQDYHVRIQVGDVFIDKQVPLCLLQSSRFNELFIIHLDVNGQIYHFDYHVNADECIKRDFVIIC